METYRVNASIVDRIALRSAIVWWSVEPRVNDPLSSRMSSRKRTESTELRIGEAIPFRFQEHYPHVPHASRCLPCLLNSQMKRRPSAERRLLQSWLDLSTLKHEPPYQQMVHPAVPISEKLPRVPLKVPNVARFVRLNAYSDRRTGALCQIIDIPPKLEFRSFGDLKLLRKRHLRPSQSGRFERVAAQSPGVNGAGYANASKL